VTVWCWFCLYAPLKSCPRPRAVRFGSLALPPPRVRANWCPQKVFRLWKPCKVVPVVYRPRSMKCVRWKRVYVSAREAAGDRACCGVWTRLRGVCSPTAHRLPLQARGLPKIISHRVYYRNRSRATRTIVFVRVSNRCSRPHTDIRSVGQ
jgi:hypothetical protein